MSPPASATRWNLTLHAFRVVYTASAEEVFRHLIDACESPIPVRWETSHRWVTKTTLGVSTSLRARPLSRLLMLPAIHDVSSSRVGMNTSLVAPLGDEMFLAIPRVSRVRPLIVNPFFYCLCDVDCPFMEDRLLRDTPKKRLDAYKRGAVLRDGPVRIVRWA